jgi:hypothetical protein
VPSEKRLGDRRAVSIRRIASIALVGLLGALMLAHAGGPDQSWMAGFWDDADSDVLVASSTDVLYDAHLPALTRSDTQPLGTVLTSWPKPVSLPRHASKDRAPPRA